MLTIQTWGGWGDVLREISLLPVAGRKTCREPCGPIPHSIFQIKNHRRVRHLPPEFSRLHPSAGAPSAGCVRDLLARCPGLKWDGEGPVSRWDKLLTRSARRICECFFTGLFDPGFQWQPGDEVPMDPAIKNIVVQTHLDGLPAKRWPAERWRATLVGLRDFFPGAAIHILDPAGAALPSGDAIVQDALTFAQAIRLVERSSLLISVDSWSKYVAGWKRIPQVVIVPDQTSDYPQLNSSTVWRHSFRGLQNDPEMALVGLRPQSAKSAAYTFGAMDNLQVQDVLESVCHLAAVK